MSSGPLQFVGSLASGLANTMLGQSMSKDLMDYQYQLQQQAIDKMNLYNSPQEQMKRLASAKLNPNLVYGSGVDGNQSSAASPGLANRRAELGNPLQDAYQAHVQEKQLQMQEIENRNAAFESRERQLKLRAETLGQMLDNTFNDRTMEDRVKMQSQNLLDKMADTDYKTQQTNNLKVAANNLVEEGNLLAERTKLTHNQALTEIVRKKSLEAGIKLTDKQVEKVAAEIEYIKSGKALRDLQYDIQDTEFNSTNELNEWLAKHPNIEMTNEVVDLIIDKINRAMGGNSTRRKGKRRK